MLENSLEKDPDKAKMYLKKISNSTQRMENLIKDVLGFSQLSNTSKKFEPVDLNDTVNDILNDFDLTIEQKKAVITTQSLPVIEAIPLQMSQLFGNLISNALKYSKPDVHPNINIIGKAASLDDENEFGLHKSADYVKITVADNGIGFNQSHAEQIFNIFQRLHGKDEFAGTGIGLAMCRKIMQNHNGIITASSEEGAGAIFSIFIPIIQEKNKSSN